MLSLSWLVSGSILFLNSLAYAEPVHLPLVHHVFPHSDSAVARSLLGVERRNTFDAGLLAEVGMYLIPIRFGTPTQILPLALSFTLPGAMVYVCNKTCSSAFNYSESTSARNKSTGTQTIDVDNTPIPGSVFTDVIGFGPFSVLDASFSSTTHNFKDPYAGTFGLGFPSASFQNLPSVWQSLLSSNPVDAPEMGIWLSRVQNTNTSNELTSGVFTFGGTNSSLYTGDIEFLDSTSTSAWALNITKLTIQGNELTLTQSRNNVALDAGTIPILGPTSSVAAIWAQVPGASQYNPGDYQYQLNDGTVKNDNEHCHGVIVGLDMAEDLPGWTFGQGFFRSVYTVLRQGNPPAIGFAELSEQAGGAPAPTLPSPASSESASSSLRSTPSPVAAKKSPVAAVVGGVVGGLFLCAALLAALLLTRRRRRQYRPDEGSVNRDLVPEPFVAFDQHPEMALFNSEQRRFRRKLQANGASMNYPYRTNAGPSSATQPGETAGREENRGSPSPAAAADVSVMGQLRNLTEEVRRLTEHNSAGSIAPPSYHPDA
ncbi:aspartic peptidase domain-containing protein [Favolaschia claudopus]|uniref:Aspartic peptidase domain-containing protein n=1 Tax=Favolaschia claudopus TaxID=2862362 RepID=A0AAW0BIQ1_9AGAR